MKLLDREGDVLIVENMEYLLYMEYIPLFRGMWMWRFLDLRDEEKDIKKMKR